MPASLTVNEGATMLCNDSAFTGKSVHKPNHPTQPQKYLLKNLPQITDFHQFLDIALVQRGRWIDFSWEADNQMFTVSVMYDGDLASPTWRAFAGDGRTRNLLWEYQSCDIPLVFNLVAAHMNMHDGAVQAEGALCTVRLNSSKARTQQSLYAVQDCVSDTTQAPVAVPKIGASKPVQSAAEEITRVSQPFTKRLAPTSAAAIPQMISTETGILTYPAFLFMLEREHYKAVRANRPLSLLIFSIETMSPGNPSSLQAPAVPIQEILPAIIKIKRKSDILAHYQDNQLALILPDTSVTHTKLVARRILRTFDAMALITRKSYSVSLGAVDVVTDGETLSVVLSAADEARRAAQQTGVRVLAYRDHMINMNPKDRTSYYQEKILGNVKNSTHATLVEQFKSAITRGASDVFSAPAFEFFLEHEYKHGLRDNPCLSAIICKVRRKRSNSLNAALLPAIPPGLLQYLAKIKRKADILAEYESDGIALVLPDSSSTDAKALARRIKTVAESGSTSQKDPSNELEVEVWVADPMKSYPELSFSPI
jgi:GGDEF domain-containing protein